MRAHEMDITTGIRDFDLDALEQSAPRRKSLANLPLRTARGLF